MVEHYGVAIPKHTRERAQGREDLTLIDMLHPKEISWK